MRALFKSETLHTIHIKRTLILRLSSLGDVVLATAALQSRNIGDKVDWVVAEEFAPILQNHPRIEKVWTYDRKAGFFAWYRLCRTLCENRYDRVIDLHRSLRTTIARLLFAAWGLRDRHVRVEWNAVGKQRFRVIGTLIFKRLWPMGLQPAWIVQKFAMTAGGSGNERPDLRHLSQVTEDVFSLGEVCGGIHSPKWWESSYVCFMPSAQWGLKCWPVENYLDVIREFDSTPVVLGTKWDGSSRRLCELLKRSSIPHVSGVGRWSIAQVGRVLSGATLYVGTDTGLAHMAEALSVPAVVIRGPTGPEVGYRTWYKASKTVRSGVWCQPCSKYGRRCYRLFNRKVCLNALSPSVVVEAIRGSG